MIPELNKIYNYFDDGKIKSSRLDQVTIKTITPFYKMDKETVLLWNEEALDCPWLYNRITDYFVVGHLNDADEDVVFVRDVNQRWFSIGWYSGSLDIDGELTKAPQYFK